MSDSETGIEPDGWPDDANYDALIGDWSIYQRARGHKTSTDDVLTAAIACRAVSGEAPLRYLDLGCGIGSVLLMTSYALRPQTALGIEAQQQSAAMARATVAKLPVEFIEVRQGDFRSALTADDVGQFDLVTASPPYFPVGTGTMPADYQRRACRFELRGGVEAYCEAGARAMTADGRLVLVFQTEWDARVLEAGSAAGLHLVERTDLLMRVDRDRPFLTVYVFSRAPQPLATSGFAIRTADGKITDTYRSLRATIGLTTAD